MTQRYTEPTTSHTNRNIFSAIDTNQKKSESPSTSMNISAADLTPYFSKSNVDAFNLNGANKRPLESIQKKLQIAYKEKNLMLHQIQTLRNKVNTKQDSHSDRNHSHDLNQRYLREKEHREYSSTKELLLARENERITWSRLLETNIRAGTLACMWCLKTHVIKRLSQAFYHWKVVAATLPSKPNHRTHQLLLQDGSNQEIAAKYHDKNENDPNMDGINEEMNVGSTLDQMDKRRQSLLSYVSKLSSESKDTNSKHGSNPSSPREPSKDSHAIYSDRSRKSTNISNIGDNNDANLYDTYVTDTVPQNNVAKPIYSTHRINSNSKSSVPSYFAPTVSYRSHQNEKKKAYEQSQKLSKPRPMSYGKTLVSRLTTTSDKRAITPNFERNNNRSHVLSPRNGTDMIQTSRKKSEIEYDKPSYSDKRRNSSPNTYRPTNIKENFRGKNQGSYSLDISIDPIVQSYIGSPKQPPYLNSPDGNESPDMKPSHVMPQQSLERRHTLDGFSRGRPLSPSPRYLIPTTASRKKTSPKRFDYMKGPNLQSFGDNYPSNSPMNSKVKQSIAQPLVQPLSQSLERPVSQPISYHIHRRSPPTIITLPPHDMPIRGEFYGTNYEIPSDGQRSNTISSPESREGSTNINTNTNRNENDIDYDDDIEDIKELKKEGGIESSDFNDISQLTYDGNLFLPSQSHHPSNITTVSSMGQSNNHNRDRDRQNSKGYYNSNNQYVIPSTPTIPQEYLSYGDYNHNYNDHKNSVGSNTHRNQSININRGNNSVLNPPKGRKNSINSNNNTTTANVSKKMTKAQYDLVYGSIAPVEETKAWSQSLRG